MHEAQIRCRMVLFTRFCTCVLFYNILDPSQTFHLYAQIDTCIVVCASEERKFNRCTRAELSLQKAPEIV